MALAQAENMMVSNPGRNEVVARAEGVSLSFKGQRVLINISFQVKKGSIVLLKGDNGSGKTTLLNLLSGFLYPDKGTLRLSLSGNSFYPAKVGPERTARAGVGRLWQEVRLFPSMTALENVLMGTPKVLGGNPLYAVALWPLVRRQMRSARRQALGNLDMLGISDRATSSADKLSLGEMKKVAIARLLQQEASLLLLDEPFAGLDNGSSASFLELLSRLSEIGKTILIVEHQRTLVEPVCSEVWTLVEGEIFQEVHRT